MSLFLVVGALAIGLSLGLMGSGGSILTVPVLVYLMDHRDKVAIAESLAIVGGIALLSAIPFAASGLVAWRFVLLFGIPGMVGTFLGATLSKYVSGTVQLTIFALVMIAAALLMWRNAGRKLEAIGAKGRASWKVMLDGLAVGTLTGFVGVGGGFLIVPAMVLLGRLEMRRAIGTSLAIIALQSSSGFVRYLDVLEAMTSEIDWVVIGLFILFGIGGSTLGNYAGSRLNQGQLRKGFAVFLCGMSLFILYQEIPKLLDARAAEASAQILEEHENVGERLA